MNEQTSWSFCIWRLHGFGTCWHNTRAFQEFMNKKKPSLSPSHGQPYHFPQCGIGGELLGSISFQLFADESPKIAENLHVVSAGEEESCFHRIILGFMCQVVTSFHNRPGGKSIYGVKFTE
uniref:PPIase cyclophilin-type domain-containing protein n=1 Tax=Mustela putorius furo TaxID=9669 RepID=M3Y9X7_MUSPF